MATWAIYLIMAGAIFALAFIVWKWGDSAIRAITARYDRAENNAAKSAAQELRANENQAAAETLEAMEKASANYTGGKDALKENRF